MTVNFSLCEQEMASCDRLPSDPGVFSVFTGQAPELYSGSDLNKKRLLKTNECIFHQQCRRHISDYICRVTAFLWKTNTQLTAHFSVSVKHQIYFIRKAKDVGSRISS